MRSEPSSLVRTRAAAVPGTKGSGGLGGSFFGGSDSSGFGELRPDVGFGEARPDGGDLRPDGTGFGDLRPSVSGLSFLRRPLTLAPASRSASRCCFSSLLLSFGWREGEGEGRELGLGGGLQGPIDHGVGLGGIQHQLE